MSQLGFTDSFSRRVKPETETLKPLLVSLIFLNEQTKVRRINMQIASDEFLHQKKIVNSCDLRSYCSRVGATFVNEISTASLKIQLSVRSRNNVSLPVICSL